MPCLPVLSRRSRRQIWPLALDPPLKLLRCRPHQRQLLLHAAVPYNAHDRLPRQHEGAGGAG